MSQYFKHSNVTFTPYPGEQILSTTISVDSGVVSSGWGSMQDDMSLLVPDDGSTTADEDSNEANVKRKKDKREKTGRKDSRSKRLRYRRLVDFLIWKIAAAPGFEVDWPVFAQSIANDTWLMQKLSARIQKHQEDLRNNAESL
jgi:hypothetical protein